MVAATLVGAASVERVPTLGPFEVHPLCLGGNVFGWTADEAQSHAVLDAYADAGGNLIDTADVYSAWASGNSGGESEAVIGRWLAARGAAAGEMLVATKVGQKPDRPGLTADNIRRAVDESLARLGRDRIDLLYAHRDDPDTPLVETLETFDALVRAGTVRAVALSNYEPDRLDEAMRIAEDAGLARPVALQPHYNLVERDAYEGPLADVAARHGLGCLPYCGLARGFLTGKYRPGGPAEGSPRASGAAAYLEHQRGPAVLAVLDEIAAAHRVPQAAVALAWLAAQPTVVAPIASARTPEQLADLLPMATLELRPDEHERLDAASAWR